MSREQCQVWFVYLEWQWPIGPACALVDGWTGAQRDGNPKQPIDEDLIQLQPDSTSVPLRKPIQSLHLEKIQQQEKKFLLKEEDSVCRTRIVSQWIKKGRFEDP